MYRSLRAPCPAHLYATRVVLTDLCVSVTPRAINILFAPLGGSNSGGVHREISRLVKTILVGCKKASDRVVLLRNRGRYRAQHEWSFALTAHVSISVHDAVKQK